MPDMVNEPPHYTEGREYEVIDVLADWFHDDGFAWQIVKYIARYRKKDNPLQDLKKARFYLDRLIKRVEETK